MACGGCGKRRAARQVVKNVEKEGVMGGFGNLTDRQVKARLEVYKKRYCKDCPSRYECDYSSYISCKKGKT